ncbi:uncharacterized protein N7498_000750 [Penicillium cinerascens]|uniref:Uncharacterized protein n=1 Tax=Penicillium cinerascens TaxID=70096 RepID=A0A9W9NF15_9EURO|nr:uncharacterized protein N7498_000750 [Penicillium cinerascens]KAJ5218651.1 hypothetical protein N7498_000750 [Penicillium cinerascens]
MQLSIEAIWDNKALVMELLKCPPVPSVRRSIFEPAAQFIDPAFGFAMDWVYFYFSVFKPFDVQGFVTSYFGLAFWAVMFVFWKVYHRTKFVISTEADLYSGKAEVDEECKFWEDGGWEERRKAELMQMY